MLGWSRWFYGGDVFPYLRLVWPDRVGLFPWEAASTKHSGPTSRTSPSTAGQGRSPADAGLSASSPRPFANAWSHPAQTSPPSPAPLCYEAPCPAGDPSSRE
ncbi:MAG TPA: DUF4262 domain-containing protein [Allosphingosinicella sp.]